RRDHRSGGDTREGPIVIAIIEEFARGPGSRHGNCFFRARSLANKNTKMTTMTRRSTLYILGAVALILAWGAGQFLFLPLLKLSFTAWFKGLATAAAGY